jgi:hypothetical protein
MQLTAYDAKWLQAGEEAGRSSGSNTFSFGFANNILNVTFALSILLWSQSLSGGHLLAMLNYRSKKTAALRYHFCKF